MCAFAGVLAGDTGPIRESRRPGVAGPPQPHPPAEGQTAIMITQCTYGEVLCKLLAASPHSKIVFQPSRAQLRFIVRFVELLSFFLKLLVTKMN